MNKTALVMGYGRSGKAAEALLKDLGYEVEVWDKEGDFSARDRNVASPLGASTGACAAEETRHSCRVAFAVVSPGIPLTHPWFAECRARGIPVKSEMQFGCEELKRRGWKLLAVTGSKGKSSVVKVVADAINRAGGRAVACGNYGVPVCEVALGKMEVCSVARDRNVASPLRAEVNSVARDRNVASPLGACAAEETRHSCRVASVSAEGRNAQESLRAAEPPRPQSSWAVVEVSSFMMETTTLPEDFFEAAVILNLQEDHLDRHGSVEVYHGLKKKLLSFAKKGWIAEEAFVSRDRNVASPLGVEGGSERRDRNVASPLGACAAEETRHSCRVASVSDEGRNAQDSLRAAEPPRPQSYFDNPILRANGEAAAELMRVAGLTDAQIADGFATFVALPHRMNLICERGGVRYVDDSKATSLAALEAGVIMAGAPVRLIAGGLPKGDDPKSVVSTLTKRVRKVYLIGQCAEAFATAWKSSVDCEICGTMERAVEAAARDAEKGETVLLSPGTASFDQFKSYGERGDVFADLVKRQGKQD